MAWRNLNTPPAQDERLVFLRELKGHPSRWQLHRRGSSATQFGVAPLSPMVLSQLSGVLISQQRHAPCHIDNL